MGSANESDEEAVEQERKVMASPDVEEVEDDDELEDEEEDEEEDRESDEIEEREEKMAGKET